MSPQSKSSFKLIDIHTVSRFYNIQSINIKKLTYFIFYTPILHQLLTHIIYGLSVVKHLWPWVWPWEGDFHMEQTGMLVGNFEINPSPKGDHLGMDQAFCDP